MDDDRYHSPDRMVQLLEAVTEAAIQVEHIKDPKAKRLLLRGIEACIEDMEPGVDFTPEVIPFTPRERPL